MAIAMYGYGWLKPAGCAKTMLGRREEEVEREEVERQLREVEMQERAAQEADEQERQARLAETGEPEEGRDLDEDIPDMDGEDGLEDDDDEVDLDGEIPDMDGEEDEEGMDGDLDDEIPEADDDENDDDDDPMSPDPDGTDSNWVYDSRREPDTDDEMHNAHASSPGNHRNRRSDRFRHGTAIVAGVRVPVPGSEYDYDEREAEELANAMLDEDEIFDQEDEDEMALERDLDDDVPEAGGESEGGWEHTDTELEDSEMDISILPPSHIGTGRISGVRPPPQQEQRVSMAGSSARSNARHSSASAYAAAQQQQQQRRSSGPWITEPSPTAAPHPGDINSRQTPADLQPQQRRTIAPRGARMVSGNQRQYLHTPETPDFSPISHGEYEDEDEDEEEEEDLPDPFNSSNAPRHHPQRQPQYQAHAPRQSSNLVPQQPSLDNSTSTSRTGAGSGTSSTRNAARSWLDGAAAAVTGGSARRTLFGRVARRTNDPAASGMGDRVGGTVGGSGSGGLFTPSPPAGAGGPAGSGAAASTAAWDDTPVTRGQGQGQGQGQAEQQQQRHHQRRRSGRFLAGRRRGADAE
ncbi:uncharacterized protein A1O9_01666 [Exophiala aquamarina CBS 119918]|uniref:Uncharacterized protein n=1 Tax=Exophiala aquamarina CBS 119918 TaxID=1182545 RepID=A0A072PWE7_9EURO|nr:uncharacterized protein A1O9_01666 [Exophiala aquamarina CBS 119918]KEF63688.1 hypothetical protein A1O9_01666 [Exophiala aquamarina CBS 119918]